MALPSLLQFVLPTPTCHPQTLLERVIEQCIQWQQDTAIVLDRQNQVRGLLRLSQMLGKTAIFSSPVTSGEAYDEGSHRGQSSKERANFASLQVQDCLPHLISVRTLSSQLPLEQLGDVLTQHPGPWVVFDEQTQTYPGILQTDACLPLLRPQFAPADQAPGANSPQPALPEVWADTQPFQPTPSGVSSPAPTLREHAWLMELSHELKNPLTALLGLSTLLQDPRLGDLTSRQHRYITLLHRTVRYLMGRVNQITDWVRVELGELQISITSVDLPKIMPEVLAALAAHLPPDASVPETLPPIQWDLPADQKTLRADPGRLKQMLLYLFTNVQQHTALDTPWGIRVEQWAAWHAITVWDEGEGIEAAKQATLIDQLPLKAHYELSRYQLVGLGLALTRNFCRLHGGDLSFISIPDQGSQFTLLLPTSVDQQTAPNPVPASDAGPFASKQMLLLVSADVELIATTATQLANTDFRLVVARSLTDAQDRLRRLRPVLLLLDPTYVNNDQDQSLRRLRYQTSLENCPIQLLGDVPFPNALGDAPSLPPLELSKISHLAERLQTIVASPRSPARLNLKGLTLLYLRQDDNLASIAPPMVADVPLPELMRYYQCRLLEVDDLEQADLLCRVWDPDIVLLDVAADSLRDYLMQLSAFSHLKSCSLVSLRPVSSQLLQTFQQLKLFSYVAEPVAQDTLDLYQFLHTLSVAVSAVSSS